MSEHEQEKLRDLLKDLETVKPLVEKYHLTWYRR
jgi:hypothetical protein